ncbi:MAG: arylsulfotransferase family protein [Planctomycetota bacterium]
MKPATTIPTALRLANGAAAALLLNALAACSDGAPPGQEIEDAAPASQPEQERFRPPDRPPGRWAKFRGATAPAKDPGLSGLGYADAYVSGSELAGAIVHDADRMEPGLTLVCTGHETSALLLDANGQVVHRWYVDFHEVFPEPLPFKGSEHASWFIRRAWAYPDGDLLAIFEYIGIARVDVNGKPRWSLANRSHHDVKVLADGTIVTLDFAERSRQWIAKRYGTRRFRKGVADSHVLFLGPDGALRRRISIFEALHSSRYAPLLSTIHPDPADIFHANSVDVLDADSAARHPRFEEGDILVSLRNPSVLIVIDGESESVKWMTRGLSHAQHQASFVPTGSILMLDNCGGNQDLPLKADQSRVIEIDPATDEILWRYPSAQNADADFLTLMLGYVERQPGGNTLVTEAIQGHLFEVTPEGDVVWEYYSPHRAGDDDELITTLMGAQRIARDRLTFLSR